MIFLSGTRIVSALALVSKEGSMFVSIFRVRRLGGRRCVCSKAPYLDLDINWIIGDTCNAPFDFLLPSERMALAEYYHMIDRKKAYERYGRMLRKIQSKFIQLCTDTTPAFEPVSGPMASA